MKRMWGSGDGWGEERRIWWIVGTAVYHVQEVDVYSDQKDPAENLGGMTTEPLERRGANRPA